MKNILFLISLLFLTNCSFAQEKITHILFLGNSYTYYNGLPSLISDMALRENKNVVVTQITRGGELLEEYAVSAMVKETIEKGNFDFVVLQEQSTAPLFQPEQVTYPAIRTLAKLIRDNKAEPILFMTWAREYGDSIRTKMLPGKFYYDVFASFDEAQDSLANSYLKIGKEINAKVAPAGLVWKEIFRRHPDLVLWRPDHNHPTETGSVIAAYSIFATIFDESVTKLRCPLPVSDSLVNEIKSVTNQLVFIDKIPSK